MFFFTFPILTDDCMCNFISRILIDNLVLINLICLVRPILTYNSEISFMDYFLVYHRAKQRAILRNGNMDHFTFIDRTPFEKVHLIICKHLLGTKKTSSNIGVRAELGRFPVENFINSQAILYLARLHTDNLYPLLKEAFELSNLLIHKVFPTTMKLIQTKIIHNAYMKFHNL